MTALLLATSLATAAATATPKGGIRGTRVVAQSSRVVVLERYDPTGPGFSTVWACRRTTGAKFDMTPRGHPAGKLLIARAAGNYAAIAMNYDGGAPSATVAGGIREVNVNTGRLQSFDGLGGRAWAGVSALVLRPTGSIAWINWAPTEVRTRARDHIRLLDKGDGIGSASLRLRSTRLSWLHNGVRRTSTLR